jgi:hypothetical protein
MIKAYAFWFAGRQIGGFAPHMRGWEKQPLGDVDLDEKADQSGMASAR